jgi:hypothetical protein
MGVTDEVGKAASGFVESMKTQPLAFALVVMNLALLGLFYIIADRLAEQRRHEVDALHQEQKETRELLSRCVVPQKQDNRTLLKLPPLPLIPSVSQTK